MGYQVGATCYPTEGAAAQASVSAAVGSVVPHGSGSAVIGAAVSGDVSPVISYTFTPTDGGAAVTVSVPYTAQPCGLMDTADGLAMGWAVAGVWLATAGVLFLRRGVHL